MEKIQALALLDMEKLEEMRAEINVWHNMDYYLSELRYERDNLSRNYYNEHSFYSHVVYDKLGVYSQAPNVEEVAINLADSYAVLDTRIIKIEGQYKRFKHYEGLYPIYDVTRLDSDRINAIYNVIQGIKTNKRFRNS